MPVKEADPNAKQLDGAFAKAMTDTPARPKDVPAPPPIDPDAPHGRDAEGTPLAPFGLTKEGRPRKTNAGRPAKEDRARLTDAQPTPPAAGTPAGPAAGQPGPQDYSAALMDAGETIWFGGSIVAKIGPQIPVIGRFIPGQKLAATMAVFDAERPRLAAALNLAAQHDARAAKLAAKLADGDAAWALSVMFMTAPFVSAAAAIWQGDAALADRQLPNLQQLAQRNEDAMDRMLAKISAQMQAAQLAAQLAAGTFCQDTSHDHYGQPGCQECAAVTNGQVMTSV